MTENNTDDRTYLVVRNHEEQYSIWLADRELPAGWDAVGFSGPKPDCLAHIGEVWTDMRPLSLRRRMEQDAVGG
ncbi:MbtH family NRPS accessory protein [Frankia sp. Ag45/Mut15]|uniref:MbtH family NRPS accessory protein n=1 Tax=Frankia umida TaxID=573489 RepID=A0ABT0K256_9ACTN|nr:MbtH family NRPS accessory protein [Frankia umida]MCK9877840.1 MbtH family NRPS accessory protein [Frankia umida]